jgi:cytochrome c peroxidase
MLVRFFTGHLWAQNPDAPPSLKTVPVPEPPNLDDFIDGRKAALFLGKALFWDMQVGSDGVTACASCHFRAGADGRIRNQMSPGLLAGDETFQTGSPNSTLSLNDFPFHKLTDPNDRFSAVLSDTNDVASSQGVFLSDFIAVNVGSAADLATPRLDPVFNVCGITTRRVEPRNTPTVINAVFNFDNFWDGRAKHVFNGINPFGASDLENGVFVDRGLGLKQELIRISNASLASQAVGPPLSDFEMSAARRTFADLGRKMLALDPLAKQLVHPNDSVLGPFSRATLNAQGRAVGEPGVLLPYSSLIAAAFKPEYWANTSQIIRFTSISDYWHEPHPGDPRGYQYANGIPEIVPHPGRPLLANEFTQMEANFALFFGLAVQMYEATLVANDTPFDRFQEGDSGALTAQQQLGLDIFLNDGRCINCHGGPEFTNASVGNAQGPEEGVVELMLMAQGRAFYDNGFYNIGVRPTADDIGRGGTDPFGFPLSYSRLAIMKRDGLLPPELAEFVPDLPPGVTDPPDRVAVDGAVKTPTLRNVELTPPFFRNGGAATLRQVVDFYTRGGDFHEANIDNLDPDIETIGGMDEARKSALVAFLLALTDRRVANEAAPFDHPQLFVPNGQKGNENQILGDCSDINPLGFRRCERILILPAVGAGGRPAAGLAPLRPPVNHFQP